MVNPVVVNAELTCSKQAEFWQELPGICGFLASKNTVKYNLRLFVNGKTVHFSRLRGPKHPLYP